MATSYYDWHFLIHAYEREPDGSIAPTKLKFQTQEKLSNLNAQLNVNWHLLIQTCGRESFGGRGGEVVSSTELKFVNARKILNPKRASSCSCTFFYSCKWTRVGQRRLQSNKICKHANSRESQKNLNVFTFMHMNTTRTPGSAAGECKPRRLD